MSDSDVEVKFGANIGGAVQRIDEVGHKLKDLDGPVREVIESFGQLRKTFIEAFAVREIAEFVTHIADLGEQAVRNAAMLGMSVESVQKLGFAAKMTGGDAEGMATSLMRLERNMAEAQSGSGKAFEAFQSLGISLNDLKAKSPEQILGMIADSFRGAEDGAAKTAIAMDLMGRAGAQMIPILDQGAEGLSRMGQLAEQTGSVLTTLEAEGLERTAQEITTLKASVEGIGISLMEVFKPAIDALIEGLTALVQTLRAAVEMIRVLVDLIEGGIATAIAGVIAKFEEFGVSASNAIGNIKTGFVTLGTVIDDVIHGHFDKAADDWVDGTNRIRQANAETAAQIAKIGQAYDSLATKIAKATAAALGFGTAEQKEEKTQLTAPTSGGAQGPDNTLALDDIKTDEEIAKLQLSMKKDELGQEVALGKLSKAQELADLQDLLGQEYDAELAALEQKKNLYAQGTAEYEEALNQEDVLLQKYLADYQKISEQMAQATAEQVKKTQAEYKSFFDTIDKSMDQMLVGVLRGTQTWQQAMAKLFDNLAVSFIEDITKMLIKAAALQALNLTGNGGGLLAQSLGKDTPQAFGGSASNASNPLTALLTTLATVITGNTAAQTLTGSITEASNAITQTTGALVTGLSTATLANTTATIANTTAEGSSSGGGFFSSLFAAIPHYDTGTSFAPGGLSILHPGEIVIPPAQSAALRSGGAGFRGASGAGGNFTINVNAIDTQTGAQFLKNNASVIAQTMSGQMRNFNPRLTG